MRARFASQVLDGWEEPDPVWLQVVRRRARFLWVRLCGINELDLGPDDRATIDWEKAAGRLHFRRETCAYLVVKFNRGVKHRPGVSTPFRREHGLRNAAEARGHWAHASGVPERVGLLLRVLRLSQPHELGVFAEDFSARWLADSGFAPRAVVLDNPVVSQDEATGRYAGLFSRPGCVRASRWPALGRFDFWGMHFPSEQLVGGLPSDCRHGLWPRLSRAQVDACHAGLPLTASATS